jgi:hypothetical protein
LNDFGDAFTWPTRDPEWVSKVLVVGLIGIIPIVGAMNLLGWTLNALDNLRGGRLELPPANFSHLGRGVNLFLVLLVYGVAIACVLAVVYGGALAFDAAAASSNSTGLAAVGALLFGLAGLVALVVTLAFGLVQPVLYLRTDRLGFGGGLDVRSIVATVRAHFVKVLLAALLMYVGGFIGSLGALLCFVGVIFTAPYGYAIMAGVLRVFEQQLAATAA